MYSMVEGDVEIPVWILAAAVEGGSLLLALVPLKNLILVMMLCFNGKYAEQPDHRLLFFFVSSFFDRYLDFSSSSV